MLASVGLSAYLCPSVVVVTASVVVIRVVVVVVVGSFKFSTAVRYHNPVVNTLRKTWWYLDSRPTNQDIHVVRIYYRLNRNPLIVCE